MYAMPVGAAEGCDLLTLFFKIKIKRSQPSAAPTQGRVMPKMTEHPAMRDNAGQFQE